MGELHDYHSWNNMSEKEYLKKAHESIENSRSYSIKEAEKILDDAVAHREQLLKSAKKIAKSAKEEYDLLNE